MKMITSEEMAKLDGLAIGKYGVSLLQMMELAGFNLAWLTSQLFPVKGLRVSVLVGKGHNGGGGLCAARHLTNRGALVRVILAQEDELKEATSHQLHTLNQMKLPVSTYNHGELPESEVIIDALLGYNLMGNPRQPIADMINAANIHGSPIISLDMPSGLNASTGDVMTPCIEADYTMTLAYPKRGSMEKVVGQLFIADIGLPLKLYRELGLEYPDFFTWKKH